MKNFDNILTEQQYSNLQQEYSKVLRPEDHDCLDLINGIISALEINGFMMPLKMQNELQNTLRNAQQILNISHQKSSAIPLNISNNPFALIHQLSLLSNKLTSIYEFKSPYYILNSKANHFVIKCIEDISKYFIKH